MHRHGFYGLASALVLTGLIAGFSAPRPALGALERSYRVRLSSDWPRWQAEPSGCTDGGDETVEGVLVRTGPESYAGTFTRRTRLAFCGAHGATAGQCELTLNGSGEVAVTAEVVGDETSPSGRSGRLTWLPLEGHSATVTGACAESFKQGMERMYLTVRHGAEVPLPAAGAAPIRQRLENYAYVVEIE